MKEELEPEYQVLQTELMNMFNSDDPGMVRDLIEIVYGDIKEDIRDMLVDMSKEDVLEMIETFGK